MVATFNLAELTPEVLAKVLNDVSVTTDAGPPATRTIPIGRGTATVKQFAMLIRGDSPITAGFAQWEIPRICQTGSPAMVYGREDKTVCATEWMGVVDPAAASEDEIFGRLVSAA